MKENLSQMQAGNSIVRCEQQEHVGGFAKCLNGNKTNGVNKKLSKSMRKTRAALGWKHQTMVNDKTCSVDKMNNLAGDGFRNVSYVIVHLLNPCNVLVQCT